MGQSYRRILVTVFLLSATFLGYANGVTHVPTEGERHEGGGGVGPKIEFPDLSHCAFLKRRRDIPFVKENWHLDASGADLMARHPAVVGAKHYDKNKIAVVDTGLKVKQNPSAGEPSDPLVKDSPEIEFDLHGTHVSGIIASKTHGMNPRLHVKAFPVFHRSGGGSNLGGISFGGRNEFNESTALNGFRHDELVSQLDRAASDPDVSIINLSIGLSTDPAILRILEKAADNGKWISIAAGNESSLNTTQTAALRGFLQRPEVFLVGALSQFGAPSSFSNFGADVRWFMPGSNIQSLDANYNPALKSEPHISFNGTSMATPAFAGIIGTLRSIEPSLNARDANDLLTLTAIRRGRSPTIAMPSGLRAAEVLSMAQELRRTGKCGGQTWRDCFETVEDALRAEAVARIKGIVESAPAREGAKCEPWEHFFNVLRGEFFLTSGMMMGKQLQDLIERAGGKQWAEMAYYLPTGRALESPRIEGWDLLAASKYTHGKELKRAKDFFSGSLLPVTELSPEAQRVLEATSPEDFLKRLPASPEHVKKYQELCTRFLRTGVDENGCEEFLLRSPRSFLFALGRDYGKAGPKVIGNTALAHLLDKHATNDGEREIAKSILSQTVKDWGQTRDVDNLDDLLVFLPRLSPEERAFLSGEFDDLRRRNLLKTTQRGDDARRALAPERIERLHAELAAHQPSEAISGKENEIALALINYGSKQLIAPAVGNFLFSTRRLSVGDPRGKQLVVDSFEALLKAAKGEGASVMEFAPANPFFSRTFTQAIADPDAARGIAKLLADPRNLESMKELTPYAPFLVGKLLSALNASDGQGLLAAIAQSWDGGALSQRGGHSRGSAPSLFDFLSSQTAPWVLSAINEVKQGPQADPAKQRLRVSYLAAMAKEAKSLTPEVQFYLKESGSNPKAILDVNPGAALQDPALKAQVMKTLAEAGGKGKVSSTDALRYLAGAGSDALRRLDSDYLDQLPQWISASKDYALPEQVGKALAAAGGNDAAFMKRALLAANETLKLAKDPESKGRGLSLVAGLFNAVSSERVTAESPEISSAVVREITSTPGHSYINGADGVLPAVIKQGLREHFKANEPKLIGDLNRNGTMYTWISQLVSQDAGSLDIAINLLNGSELQSTGTRQGLRNAVVALLLQRPDLRATVKSTSQDSELNRALQGNGG